jgi:hypothetical protein
VKGHLLAAIEDASRRIEAGKICRDRFKSLKRFDDNKEEDAEAITFWLRSQDVESIRERKKKHTMPSRRISLHGSVWIPLASMSGRLEEF